MSSATFALVFGLAYLGAGVAGMLPLFLSPPPLGAPETQFTFLYGYLFGLFPVNALHSAVHVMIGLWGLSAALGAASSRRYARGLAVFYGTLALMGLMPELKTLFGLLPLHGHDVWLHAGSAAIAAYFGWHARAAGSDRRGAIDRRQAAQPIHTDRRRSVGDRRRGYGMHPA